MSNLRYEETTEVILFVQSWLRRVPSLPLSRREPEKKWFGPPNEEIISFQLQNYLICSHQKLRHEIEANSLACSTADEGESGKLKGNSTYQL